MRKLKAAGNGNRLCRAAIMMLTALVLTGCGGSTGNTAAADHAAAMEMAAEEAPEAGVNDGAPAGGYDGGEGGTQKDAAAVTNRKLIREVYLNVETENFIELTGSVEERVRELGGYIENSYNSGGGSTGSLRHGEICARIPQQRLDEFVSSVEGASNVTSKRENTQDVTMQYIDLESHKKALLAEQESLLGLLERAESLEDIITLQSRLTDVRYQLESMESQLRVYDNQVEYSTVNLNIDEVIRLTPAVDEKSAWERMRTGFSENVYRVGRGLENFGIGLVVSLPYLLLLAVIVLIVILFIRLIIKAARKAEEKNREKARRNRYMQQMAPGAPGMQPGPGLYQAPMRPENPSGAQPAETEKPNGQ